MRKRKAESSGPIHEAAKPGAGTASSPLLGGPWEEEQGTSRPHPFHELALPKSEVCILNYGNCSANQPPQGRRAEERNLAIYGPKSGF
jgi:hypothetical protein